MFILDATGCKLISSQIKWHILMEIDESSGEQKFKQFDELGW